MKFSVILVNWNGRDCIGGCLDSIPGAAAGLDVEVIVVDNLSEDSSVPYLQESYPAVKLIQNRENRGFGRGAQTGIDEAKGEFVAVVNPDVVLEPGALRHLVGFLEAHPAAAWAGPKVVQPDGTLQGGPLALDSMFEPLRLLPGLARLRPEVGIPDSPQRCGQLRGSCMVFRSSMLADIGGMPACTFHYGEEQVLGARFRDKGYEVWFDPRCTVVHQMGHSAKQKWSHDDRKMAVRIGRTESMRQTLGRPQFVVHNLLLVICLLARLVAGWLGRGDSPRLVWRMIKVSFAALRRPQIVPGQPSQGPPPQAMDDRS
jgi:GT2 family glycosyltransferase